MIDFVGNGGDGARAIGDFDEIEGFDKAEMIVFAFYVKLLPKIFGDLPSVSASVVIPPDAFLQSRCNVR